MDDVVYVAVQVKSFTNDGFALDWDLGGVFTTTEAAEAICVKPGDSYWPVTLNEFLGRETVAAPGQVNPIGFIGENSGG